MEMTKQQIAALARLARLDFDEERAESFLEEFQEFVAFADGINRTVEGGTADIREVGGKEVSFGSLREDKTEESLPAEKILSNVRSENGYFSVRRTVR